MCDFCAQPRGDAAEAQRGADVAGAGDWRPERGARDEWRASRPHPRATVPPDVRRAGRHALCILSQIRNTTIIWLLMLLSKQYKFRRCYSSFCVPYFCTMQSSLASCVPLIIHNHLKPRPLTSIVSEHSANSTWFALDLKVPYDASSTLSSLSNIICLACR